jgi:predicted nucleic acid-binding Zn ribbon protein
VGPIIAKNTRAVKIKGKTLIIEVSHGVWKQELSLRKRELIERVNLEIEKSKHGKKIEDLFFLDNPGLKVK